MNEKELYAFSEALHAFVGFSDNLKGSVHYNYKTAASVSEVVGPEIKELTRRLATTCAKEREKLLEMLLEGRKYVNILIGELETVLKVEELRNE
tara:strand:- start:33 stop:314 length:282 start_codon:yes stop_codon:yes gene_type:complete